MDYRKKEGGQEKKTGQTERLREVANWCMIKKWMIALISEIKADSEGEIHLGEGKRQTIIVHGKKQQFC